MKPGWRFCLNGLTALALYFAALPAWSSSAAHQSARQATPETLWAGARLYQHRCVICHGTDGLGEGALALVVKDYPNTNLLQPRVALDPVMIRRAIAEGPEFAGISPLMPPWDGELSDAEIDALTQFVAYLRADLPGASHLSRMAAESLSPSIKLGRALFVGRCAVCHGQDGEGTGRLASRLHPQPANLTLSHMPEPYLRAIISGGGAPLGRSPGMPAWRQELSTPEIESLILHINRLRHEGGDHARQPRH